MNFSIPPRFLEQVDTIIEENLSNEHFNVTELSNQLGLCTSQIYRKIKQETDLCPTEYIRNLRLDYARELIEFSDLNMSQIAYAVGFSSLSYFSTCFRGVYGCTPTKWRSKE